MNTRTEDKRSGTGRALLLLSVAALIVTAAGRMRADTGSCGGQMITLPFTDVLASNVFFCAIAAAFFTSAKRGQRERSGVSLVSFELRLA